MIFVPSVKGISHSPRENTPDHVLVHCVQASPDVAVESCRSPLT
jgi:hypothetical protein